MSRKPTTASEHFGVILAQLVQQGGLSEGVMSHVVYLSKLCKSFDEGTDFIR